MACWTGRERSGGGSGGSWSRLVRASDVRAIGAVLLKYNEKQRRRHYAAPVANATHPFKLVGNQNQSQNRLSCVTLVLRFSSSPLLEPQFGIRTVVGGSERVVSDHSLRRKAEKPIKYHCLGSKTAKPTHYGGWSFESRNDVWLAGTGSTPCPQSYF
jgi:hypothetical protein